MMNRTKTIQFIFFSSATLIGFIFYLNIGFPLHFFNHYFAGIGVGLMVLIGLNKIGKTADRYEYIIPFLFWMFAIIPEWIPMKHEHQENQPDHPEWTNIFLFHEWLDQLLEKSILTIAILGALTVTLLLL